jgi:hypothetical protein
LNADQVYAGLHHHQGAVFPLSLMTAWARGNTANDWLNGLLNPFSISSSFSFSCQHKATLWEEKEGSLLEINNSIDIFMNGMACKLHVICHTIVNWVVEFWMG